MDTKEEDIRNDDIISMLLTGIAYLISPILFIWSVNTLFNCNIAFSFKTWLAGLILVMLLRFHLKGSDNTEIYYESDDEEESDDAEDKDHADALPKHKGKLIPYQEHKDKRKTPTDKT